MAEINHTFSYTFKPGNDQWVKINLELIGIDTNTPLRDQLEAIDETVVGTWAYLKGRIDSEMDEILDEAGSMRIARKDKD